MNATFSRLPYYHPLPISPAPELGYQSRTVNSNLLKVSLPRSFTIRQASWLKALWPLLLGYESLTVNSPPQGFPSLSGYHYNVQMFRYQSHAVTKLVLSTVPNMQRDKTLCRTCEGKTHAMNLELVSLAPRCLTSKATTHGA